MLLVILLITTKLILIDDFNMSYNTSKRLFQDQTQFYRVFREFKVIFEVSKFRFLNST